VSDTTNPLIAERHDSTRGWSGISLAEGVADLAAAYESGSWIDGTLGGVGASLDALGLVVDPIGSVVSWGVAWLFEHVKPLSDALDWLAGDPDQITAYAQTWHNVSQAVAGRATDLGAALGGVSGWTGAAADAYRAHVATLQANLNAGARISGLIGQIVEGAGLLVSLVRQLVRDLIADFVSVLAVRLWEWLAEEACTLGIATPLVVAQVGQLVAKWAAKIAKVLAGLARSIRKLTPILHRLQGMLDEMRAMVVYRGRIPQAGPGSVRHISPSGIVSFTKADPGVGASHGGWPSPPGPRPGDWVPSEPGGRPGHWVAGEPSGAPHSGWPAPADPHGAPAHGGSGAPGPHTGSSSPHFDSQSPHWGSPSPHSGSPSAHPESPGLASGAAAHPPSTGSPPTPAAHFQDPTTVDWVAKIHEAFNPGGPPIHVPHTPDPPAFHPLDAPSAHGADHSGTLDLTGSTPDGHALHHPSAHHPYSPDLADGHSSHTPEGPGGHVVDPADAAYGQHDAAHLPDPADARTFGSNAEGAEYGRKTWADAESQLTDDQRNFLRGYTHERDPAYGEAPNYKDINGFLRGERAGDPFVEGSIQHIDEAMRIQPVPEDITVTRETGYDAFNRPIERLRGSMQHEPGYLSTALGNDPTFAPEKPVVLHLQVPAGTPAMYMEALSVYGGSERELLLGRDLPYMVDRVVEAADGRFHVHGRVVRD
jgi:hypothetical protein